MCAFTSDLTEARLFRLLIETSDGNELRTECRLMVDKVASVRKTKLGVGVGQLGHRDMHRLNRAL